MPPVGFEPAIQAREPPQSHALDRAGRAQIKALKLDSTFLSCIYITLNPLKTKRICFI
jgi:hypothetical protein